MVIGMAVFEPRLLFFLALLGFLSKFYFNARDYRHYITCLSLNLLDLSHPFLHLSCSSLFMIVNKL